MRSKAHTRAHQFKPMTNIEDSCLRFIVSIAGVDRVVAGHIPGWDKAPAGSLVAADSLNQLRMLAAGADNSQAEDDRMAGRRAVAAIGQAAGWDRTSLAGSDRTSAAGTDPPLAAA